MNTAAGLSRRSGSPGGALRVLVLATVVLALWLLPVRRLHQPYAHFQNSNWGSSVERHTFPDHTRNDLSDRIALEHQLPNFLVPLIEQTRDTENLARLARAPVLSHRLLLRLKIASPPDDSTDPFA